MRSAIAILIVGLVATSSMAGCFGEEKKAVEDVSAEEEVWPAYSVVAPIDTGINVYHDHFRTNDTYPQWLLDGLGVNKICNLTFNGSYEE